MITSVRSKVRPEGGIGLLPGEERRRSQRVIIRVPVTLEVGKAEPERILAHTVAVNIHGAMVVCKRNIDPETKIVVLNDRTRDKMDARVSRAPRESAEGFLVPIEFMAPAPNFWQITFPPATWKPSDE